MVSTPAMAHKDPTIFPQTPTGLRKGNVISSYDDSFSSLLAIFFYKEKEKRRMVGTSSGKCCCVCCEGRKSFHFNYLN